VVQAKAKKIMKIRLKLLKSRGEKIQSDKEEKR